MMRLCVAVLLAAGAACSAGVSSPRDVSAGQEIALRAGESARISNSSVVLGLLQVNDSRCPSDVQCVTAGDVNVIIQFQGTGALRTDTLHVTATPKSATYGGYRVEVVSVLPYPISTQTGAAKTVTFGVTSSP
jgi:hypothetical protein